jgi:hypothetical protein
LKFVCATKFLWIKQSVEAGIKDNPAVAVVDVDAARLSATLPQSGSMTISLSSEITLGPLQLARFTRNVPIA